MAPISLFVLVLVLSLFPLSTCRSDSYTHVRYPDLSGGRHRSQDELCQITKEAWDEAVHGHDLEELMDSMLRRIRAVLDVNGGPTEYLEIYIVTCDVHKSK